MAMIQEIIKTMINAKPVNTEKWKKISTIVVIVPSRPMVPSVLVGRVIVLNWTIIKSTHARLGIEIESAIAAIVVKLSNVLNDAITCKRVPSKISPAPNSTSLNR
jgi:hypothetical protein